MSKGQSLQDPFLNALRKDRIPVSIFLVNGIKLQGQIESFDQYVVLLKNTVNQMVYKHAISTVVPTRNPRTDGNSPSSGYSSTPVGVMSSSSYQGNQGFGGQGFERQGFGSNNRPIGGFTRTSNSGFERQGGFDRGFSGGYGFERQGGFDRSSFEERGFDGQNFDKADNRGFDGKDFDNKFDSHNDD